MGAKLFVDKSNYPQVESMVTGQRIKVTMDCCVESCCSTGVNLSIEGMALGKKGKMNTQEILLANRLERIESKLGGQAVAM